jgi:hypothetical protein
MFKTSWLLCVRSQLLCGSTGQLVFCDPFAKLVALWCGRTVNCSAGRSTATVAVPWFDCSVRSHNLLLYGTTCCSVVSYIAQLLSNHTGTAMVRAHCHHYYCHPRCCTGHHCHHCHHHHWCHCHRCAPLSPVSPLSPLQNLRRNSTFSKP